MSTVLARRLGKLEASVQADLERQWQTAMARLFAMLTPEHKRSMYDWVMRPETRAAACTAGHSGSRVCVRCIEAAAPPSLVRAMWMILVDHVERGAPIAFPLDVAQVYVDHADAVPAIRCTGCGYLLPARGSRLAFSGSCPGCPATVTD